MAFSTYILTAPRPQSTLCKTILSCLFSGFSPLTVFDGSPPAGVKPSPQGCTDAYIRLFRSHLDETQDGDALIFEDDVIVCRGLCDYLNKMCVPEEIAKIGILSPYCPTAYSNYGDDSRWHREDARYTIAGTQAFLYTRAMMELLVAELEPHKSATVDGLANYGSDGVDVQIGRVAQKHDLHIWYHKPSLVQHVGICNSSVGYQTDLGTIYSAETFPGEDFDARSLL
jgi:hypothetical protein